MGGAPLFPVGRVVPTDDLVGREPAVGDLMSRLKAGQNLIVAGPRRIGKTSVMQEALRRLRLEGYLTARVDLLGVATVREMAEMIVDACLENLTKTHRTLEALKGWVRGQAPELQFKTTLGPFAEMALSLAASPRRDRQSDMAVLDGALRLPQDMAERAGRRFVFAYDEFQTAGRIAPALLGRMRSVMIHQQQVGYAFLGSQESLLRLLFARRNEPFYRFATDWALPSVPAEEWMAYLRVKFVQGDLPPSDMAVREILRLTGGHPMDTMLLAHESAQAARQLTPPAITADAVLVAAERVRLSLDRAFGDAWANMPPAQQHVLKRVATGGAPYGQPAPNPTQVRRAIAHLLAGGVIEGTTRQGYRFTERMFEDYVRSLAR